MQRQVLLSYHQPDKLKLQQIEAAVSSFSVPYRESEDKALVQ
jgi:hypothetical protein